MLQYRKDIDGLRALAVIPVILFHAGIDVFSGGYIGVDVFFVISGFLITTILITELESDNFSIKRFYERRARRILPALIAIMLFCLPLAYYLMSPSELKSFSRSIFAVAIFASNILFYKESGYFAAAAEEKPLLHTWSLAIEEQYYILFPIFLWVIWRYRRHWLIGAMVVITTVSFALCQYFINQHPDATFYLLPTRAWELFAGSVLAYLMRYKTVFAETTVATSQKVSLIGLLMVVVPMFAFDKTTPFPSVYALLPVLGTVLIIAYSRPHTMVYKLLSLWPLVGIGLISYSAYLWHQPLFAFLRLEALGQPNPVHMYMAAAASIIVGYFSWRYIERPFRHKERFDQKRIFKYAFVAISCMAILGLIGNHTEGFLSLKFNQNQQKIYALAEHSPMRGTCHTTQTNYIVGAESCVLGDGQSQWAVLGNSHGVELAYALSLKLKKKGQAVQQHTISGCANVYKLNGNDHCADWTKKTMMYLLEKDSPQNIVVSYRSDQDNLENTHALRHMVEDLQSANKTVYFVTQAPILEHDIEKYITNNPTNLDNIPSLSIKSWQEKYNKVTKVMSALPKTVNIINTQDLFCGQQDCYAIKNGIPLFFDDNHMSVAGASIIADAIIVKHFTREEK